MIRYDINNPAGGGSYPVFTFVNLRDNSVYTKNRYSSIS